MAINAPFFAPDIVALSTTLNHVSILMPHYDNLGSSAPPIMTSQWDRNRNENNATVAIINKHQHYESHRPPLIEVVEMKTHDPLATPTTSSPTRMIQKKKHSYHLRDDYLEDAVAANNRIAGSRRIFTSFSHPKKVDHPSPRRHASWP